MQRILVLGGSGLVGSRIIALNAESFDFIAPTHGELDVTDEPALRETIRRLAPDQIIYATGFARMDAAETNPDEATLLNDTVPGWIAEETWADKTPFHYLSTNAVFSGNKFGMRHEDEEPDPINVYGKSKYAGERTVLAASPQNSVLRLISVYSAVHPRVDFVRRLLSQLKSGETAQGISDVIFNPLSADCAARAIGQILQHRATGIYHLGATDEMSNLAFTELLARTAGYDTSRIASVTQEMFRQQRPGAPQGPQQSLSTEKFTKQFGEDILLTNERSVQAFLTQHSST